MKKWKSCAKWEGNLEFSNSLTTDQHDTKEQAEAVCEMLERDGFGGDGIHFPINTWVEPIPYFIHHNKPKQKISCPFCEAGIPKRRTES